MGFLPGFGFLGEVDTRIATPRLAAPRKKVPAGSVAIADRQTAVYPRASAGGWNIIGKTTHNLFDSGLDSLSPLSFGKRVRFNPITKEEFLAQGGVL
jgi:KipI family sensor histidine kinase inhibitor